MKNHTQFHDGSLDGLRIQDRDKGIVHMTKKIYTWKEAFEDSHEAAKARNPIAQNFVGYCYDVGRGVSRDLKMARYWYEKAARNGQIDAIFNLAVMNSKGLGMRRNASRAFRLYCKAALLGDLQSQANLAVMLLDGDGAKKDVTEGFRWLRHAAQRGDPKAQYNLGRAYLYGEDIRKSDTYAQKWLRKAATGGHVKARRLLKSLQKKAARSGTAKSRAVKDTTMKASGAPTSGIKKRNYKVTSS